MNIGISKCLILDKAISTDIAKVLHSRPSFELIEKSLVFLKILNEEDILVSYKDLNAWHRGGSESYISDFFIDYSDCFKRKKSLHIIGKAIISLVDTEVKWKQWNKRFQLLEKNGIYVPRNFCFWNGIIFQEYVPFNFSKYFVSAEPSTQKILSEKLLEFARKIDNSKFFVTGLMHNLRTDGDNIYIIDVGGDLGEPVAHSDYNRTINIVSDWLRLNKVVLKKE